MEVLAGTPMPSTTLLFLRQGMPVVKGGDVLGCKGRAVSDLGLSGLFRVLHCLQTPVRASAISAALCVVSCHHIIPPTHLYCSHRRPPPPRPPLHLLPPPPFFSSPFRSSNCWNAPLIHCPTKITRLQMQTFFFFSKFQRHGRLSLN